MTTTNEMIFKTLKTKADKPAKFAEQLREMGYEVKNTWTGSNGTEYENEYWSVNGVEFGKGDSGPVFVSLRGYRHVERLDAIKRIDFVNYFATYDERKEKAERMAAHDEIEQRHDYWKNEREFYIADDGTEYRWYKYGCKRQVRRYRHHRTIDVNHTVEEYKSLKRKAEAAGWGYWREGESDSEIKWAEKWLADAEAKVEKLWKQLEEAEREVKRRKQDVQKAIDKKAEGGRELDAWLKAKGIRKEVA